MSLGVKKSNTLDQNSAVLLTSLSPSGRKQDGALAYTPSEAHFLLNSLHMYWKTGDSDELKAHIHKLKRLVEDTWPSEFESRANA
jgi:hypothetical protein